MFALILCLESDLTAHLELLGKLPVADRSQYDQLDLPKCLVQTRSGILNEIMGWIKTNDEKQVYWLNGGAGTGKTTVALTIAETIAMDKSKLSASFFCSRAVGDRSSSDRIFPTIARVLADRDAQFRGQLLKAIRQNDRIGFMRPSEQFRQLIMNPLQELGTQPPTVIILDALDECTDHGASERILAALASQLESVPFLRVFVSCRPTSSTEDAFAGESLRGR